MEIDRKASIVWSGAVKDGKGEITTQSHALEKYPYGFTSRFGDQKGSNPEELLAASHGACFTMALSLVLGEAQLVPETIETSVSVTLASDGPGFSITKIKIKVRGDVPGCDIATFVRIAEMAKDNCPLSKALKVVPIELDAALL